MKKTLKLCLASDKNCEVKIFSSSGTLLAKKVLTSQKCCLCLQTCSKVLVLVATHKAQTQKKYLRLLCAPCQSFVVHFLFPKSSLQTFFLLDANFGIAVPKAVLTFEN